MAKKKRPEIELTVKSDKLSYVKETYTDEYDKLIKDIKKLYGADEVYLENNKIVIHRVEVVGTWKSKRIDGVKV